MRKIACLMIFSALAIALSATPAAAKIYGGKPLNISTGADGSGANGASGQPTVSGDNRFSRLVAFTSEASNLVAGDDNASSDIFIWTRPAGKAGSALASIGVGGPLQNATAGANGDSSNPSLDGSMRKAPHCVAFQSKATNLVPGDATDDWDIYVRDLRTGAVKLASAGIAGDATNPSLAGDCSQLVFEAGGSVLRSAAKGWTTTGSAIPSAKLVGAGDQARLSLEGTTVVWRAPGNKIKFLTKGKRAKTVGSGSGPWASDLDRVAGWGVTFQSGKNVISRKISRKGRVKTRATIKNAVFGGSTAYVPNRGIIVYARGSSFWYFNANSGNSDDLAHAGSAITEMGSSARGTLMVFAATGGDKDFIDTAPYTPPPTVVPVPGTPDQQQPPCPTDGTSGPTGPTCGGVIPGTPDSTRTIPGTPVRYQAVYVKSLPTKGCGSGC